VNPGRPQDFDEAALSRILDEYNNDLPNSGEDLTKAARLSQLENTYTQDQDRNIDPELTREGRGKTP
jgi:hypothetical protein